MHDNKVIFVKLIDLAGRFSNDQDGFYMPISLVIRWSFSSIVWIYFKVTSIFCGLALSNLTIMIQDKRAGLHAFVLAMRLYWIWFRLKF